MEVRQKHFEERSLYSLFRNVVPDAIFDFLREIGVLKKKKKKMMCNGVMFVLSVLRECSCRFLCEMFYDLWNE